MSKGNGKLATITSREDMERRVETARDCHKKQKEASAESVAEVYLLSREVRLGQGKQWFDEEIGKFNLLAETANAHLKSEQDRAKKFIDGMLTKNDHLNTETTDESEAKAHEEERVKLRALHAMSASEKMAAKLFSAKERDDSSKFMPIVRYVFNFNRQHHGALVSRYCLALEWVAAKFDGKAPVDVEMIKEAILSADGFDRIVETQREVGKADSEAQRDAEIIREALAEEAKGIAREVAPKGVLDINAKNAKDGFVLLLGRISGDGVAVLGEAESTDNEIDTAVRKFGKTTLVGDDEDSMEFMGRVIEIASIIKEKQEIMGGADGKTKITTDRIFSLKADSDGSPHLVVSVNHADSGPVFYAKPKVENLLSLEKGACVLSGSTRRRLEKEMDDPARRRFLTLVVNKDPKRADGRDAESALSWDLHNRALAKANRSTANQSFYWTSLGKVTARPLDIDNFRPQFHCELGQNEVHEIFEQLLKPWKSNYDSKKSSRVFTLWIRDQQASIICGDADPKILSAKVECRENISMNFRIADLHSLFEVLCELHGSDYRLSGDPAGLLRLSWADRFGDYGFHQPTVGSDGRLLSRRVGPMMSDPVLLAAE